MNGNFLKEKILRFDFFLPLSLLIFIGALFVTAQGYGSRTAELPLIIGGISLCLLALELGLRLFSKKKKDEQATQVDQKIEEMRAAVDEVQIDDPRIARMRLLVASLSMVFFVVFINIIGFIPTALILSIGVIRLLGYKRWMINLIFSLLFVGGSYFVFDYLFGITLPMGIIFEFFFP